MALALAPVIRAPSGTAKPRATNRTACSRRKKRRSVARANARARRCRSYGSKPSSSGVRALRIGPAYREERFLGKLLATYLGGHQNRKQDHRPGWLVLWRGWMHLQSMLEGAAALGVT